MRNDFVARGISDAGHCRISLLYVPLASPAGSFDGKFRYVLESQTARNFDVVAWSRRFWIFYLVYGAVVRAGRGRQRYVGALTVAPCFHIQKIVLDRIEEDEIRGGP